MTGYPLRPVQALRERDERGKRSELATAVGDASEADARLATATARVVELRVALRHTVPTTSVAELVRAERYRTRLRGLLEIALLDELHAREARDGRAASVELARDRLVLARAARRVVETHFARWRDEQRKLAERRED